MLEIIRKNDDFTMILLVLGLGLKNMSVDLSLFDL